MAAFLWHGVSKTGKLVSPKNVILRPFATKAEKKKGMDRKIGPKINPTAQSLADKGFLRPQKEYIPKEDVQSELDSVYKSLLGTTSPDTKFTDINSKFNLLRTCEEKIGHNIPSALLHCMQTLRDVTTFFKTPVDARTPYEKMKDVELPENLNVQFDYLRFQDYTDPKFAVSAFPGSSTIVTGLRWKEKYKGHVAPKADKEYKTL